MQRISSRTTPFFKHLYPWILLGSVPFFVAVGFVWRQPIIVGPIIVAVIGFVIVKQLASQLVDEVWNAGDALIIRNKGQEDRIPLSAIVNVQFPWGRRQTVRLTLRRPGVFGDAVTFLAPVPFCSIPVINNLIDQLEDARRRA